MIHEGTVLIALAVVLLAGGVVGSVVPVVPGGLLSIAGVLVYWWATDFAEPGAVLLVGLVLVGVVAVAVDWLAGAISAKVAGASTKTTLLAAAVGFVLLFVFGPLGLLVGTVGTVFAVEFYRGGEARRSARTAALTAVGMLGSTVAQVALTGSVLLVMVGVMVF